MPLPVLWFSDRHPLIKGFTMRSIFFSRLNFLMKVDRRHRKQNRKKKSDCKNLRENWSQNWSHKPFTVSTNWKKKNSFWSEKQFYISVVRDLGLILTKELIEYWKLGMSFSKKLLVLQMQMCFRLDLGGFMEL